MFQVKRNDDMVRNLRMRQEELGLQVFPKLNSEIQYTEDESLAIYYLLSNKPVPDEVKEKILSVRKWELPLYKMLFDIEYLKGRHGVEHTTHFISMKFRSYLKIREDEKEKLKQIQEQFLNNWGFSYAESVAIPKEILSEMEEQFVMFKGYMTLDRLEEIVNKKGKKRDIISYRSLSSNDDLLSKIRHKLEDANIIKRKELNNDFFYGYEKDDYNENMTDSFSDDSFDDDEDYLDEEKQENVVENKNQKKKLEEEDNWFLYQTDRLQYLPAENLKKILDMEYTKNITFSQWMQELQKQGLFYFTPYLCKDYEGSIFMVLDYNEHILWDTFPNEFLLTSNGSRCNSISVDNQINVKLQKMIKKLYEKRNYDNIGNTELLQLLFYMCIVNIGIHSRAFHDRLLNHPELLDDLVATLGIETKCFDEFDFKFDKVLSFMKKEERNFESLMDMDNVDTFRVPAYYSNFDLCRVAVYNSLNMVLEHCSDCGSKRMRFNLEPLLEQMDWLTEQEKQSILTNRTIRNTVFIFLLAVRGITLDTANTYIKKEFPMLPKLNRELSIVCGLNDLMY